MTGVTKETCSPTWAGPAGLRSKQQRSHQKLWPRKPQHLGAMCVHIWSSTYNQESLRSQQIQARVTVITVSISSQMPHSASSKHHFYESSQQPHGPSFTDEETEVQRDEFNQPGGTVLGCEPGLPNHPGSALASSCHPLPR